MKVTQESAGENIALLKIEVGHEDYKPAVGKALKEYAKKAQMPGFRKGNVPLSLVEKMYGKQVLAEELNKLTGDAIYQHIQDNNLDLIGSPLSNDEKTGDIDFENQTDFVFFFDMALKPVLNLDLEKISVTEYAIEPDKETLEKYQKEICQRYGKFESPETIESEKDLVFGKLEELEADGSVKEGGVSSYTSIALDMIESDDIRNSFIGKKKDDIVNFQYREAFNNPVDMASMLRISKEEAEKFNAPVHFTISGISRMEPHPLDEELFAKAFPNESIKTEKEFAERIRKDLAKTYEKESERKFLTDCFEALLENTSVSLPKEFLARWIAINSDGKTTEADVQNDWSNYEKSIKWQVIESEVMKANNVDVTREELLSFVKTNVVEPYFPVSENEEENQDREKKIEEMCHFFLEKKDQAQRIVQAILDEKLAALLKEKVKVTTKKVSLDEFVKLLTKEEK